MSILLAAAAATLVVDVVSKRLVVNVLAEGRLYPVAPGWGLRRVTNRRASLSPAPGAALLTVVVGALLVAEPRSLTAFGLGMAVGGAAGNLVDRVLRGGVTDFVAAGPWPVFNLADAAMTVGMLVAAGSVL